MSIKRHSFWWENSPPDFVLQPQLPHYSDIVIIGAGFAGIMTAYWIARILQGEQPKKPHRIVLVDEAPHPAFKSSGRMTGSIYLGSNKLASEVVEQLGEKTAHNLYRYSQINNEMLSKLISRTPCDAEFNGGIRVASTAKEAAALHKSAKIMKAWGLHPVLFDQHQSQHVAIMPLNRGSMFIPTEGLFDPFILLNDIVRVLRHHRISVVYGAQVASASTASDGTPSIILNNGHLIVCSKIVHTTSNTIPCQTTRDALVCQRQTVARTAPISADLDDMPLPLMPIELNGGMDSVRIHDRSVIMVGGKSGLRKEDPELGVTNDSSFNQRILDALDSTMVRNFPFSNHVELSHAWTYIETEASDGLPLVGELPEHNGHYVNIAFGRNKFGLAFLSSKNLAERILRKKVQNTEFSIFSPKRLMRDV